MVKDVIDLKTLNMEELAGVVSIYPWYAGAREEMCRRMAALGTDAWSAERYAEYALYVGSRRVIFDLMHGRRADAYADAGAQATGGQAEAAAPAQPPAQTVRDILVVGGDYFSKEDYARVHEDSDDLISSACGVPHAENLRHNYSESPEISDLCTETLAELYLEQGYPEQAKSIYSKLMLANPKKNAYFAALIEKIENKTI